MAKVKIFADVTKCRSYILSDKVWIRIIYHDFGIRESVMNKNYQKLLKICEFIEKVLLLQGIDFKMLRKSNDFKQNEIVHLIE